MIAVQCYASTLHNFPVIYYFLQPIHIFKALNNHVALLIPELNNPSSSAEVVLAALVDIASHDPTPLDNCLPALEDAISRRPSLLSMAAKIFGAVGRLNEVHQMHSGLLKISTEFVKPILYSHLFDVLVLFFRKFVNPYFNKS